MSTEAANNVPANPETLKEEAPSEKVQAKEETPALVEKGEKEETVTPPKSEPLPPKPITHKLNYEKDMIYLYQFSRTPIVPSTSAYCLKVETWLRLIGLKYENVDHRAKYKSKKGLLPFIELNGEEVDDSTAIINTLSEKFTKDIDSSLTPEQRNMSHAMISMIENHLSWVVLYWRAKNPLNFLKAFKIDLQTSLNTRMPKVVLNSCFQFNFGRKGLKRARAHGIGLHTQEEVLEFGKNDLRVLSDLLSDKPYFFGNDPCMLDIVAFANLAQIHFVDKEVAYPLRDAMNDMFPNLVGLVNRIKERAFNDWETMCASLDLNTHIPKPVKDVKEAAKENKEGTEPAEKQPLPDEPEKKPEGEGDEKVPEKNEDEKKAEKDN